MTTTAAAEGEVISETSEETNDMGLTSGERFVFVLGANICY